MEGGLESATSEWKYRLASSYTSCPTANWDCLADRPPDEWKTDPAFDDSSWAVGLMSFGVDGRPAYNYNASGSLRTSWGTQWSGLYLRRVVEVPANLDVDTLIGINAVDDSCEFYVNGVYAMGAAGPEGKDFAYTTRSIGPEGRAALRPGQKNLFAIRVFTGPLPAFIDLGLRSSPKDWPCGNATEETRCYQDAGGDATRCCLVTDESPNCCTAEGYSPDDVSGKCRPPPSPSSPAQGKNKHFLLLIIILVVVLLLALLAGILTAVLCYRRRKKRSSYASINGDDDGVRDANAYTPRAAVATPSQYQPSLPRVPVGGMNVRNTKMTSGY